jgi:hypothetical protein
MAESLSGARSRQVPAGYRSRGGPGRGLPGRRRHAASRAEPSRAEPAVLGSVACYPTVSRLVDALAADGQRAMAAIRDRAGRSPQTGLEVGRQRRAGRRWAGDHGTGRGPCHRALRQTRCRRDLEENLWPPPADGVRRRRPQRVRGTGGGSAAAGQCHGSNTAANHIEDTGHWPRGTRSSPSATRRRCWSQP